MSLSDLCVNVIAHASFDDPSLARATTVLPLSLRARVLQAVAMVAATPALTSPTAASSPSSSPLSAATSSASSASSASGAPLGWRGKRRIRTHERRASEDREQALTELTGSLLGPHWPAAELSLRGAPLALALACVGRCTRVTRFTLTHTWHVLTTLQAKMLVSSMPLLQHVDLTGCGAARAKERAERCGGLHAAAAKVCIAPWAAAPHLTHFTVAHCPGLRDRQLVKFLHRCQGPLRVLNVKACTALTDAAFVQGLRRSLVVASLRSLDARRVPGLGDDGVRALAACRRLERLLLDGGGMNEGLLYVAHRCRYLVELDVSLCTAVSEATLHRILANQRARLRRLAMFRCTQLGTGSLLTAFAAPFASLKRLDLSGCAQVTPDVVAAVAQANPGLQELALNGILGLSDDALVPLAQHLRVLRVLELNLCTRITEAPLLAWLAAVAPGVHKVCLAGCRNVGPALVRALVDAHGTTLHHVTLSGCTRIDDAAVLHLARGCRSLESVGFKGLPLRDPVTLLTLLHNNAALRNVNVSGVHAVTDAVVNQLFSSAVPFLSRFYCSGCNRLSPSSEALLRRQCSVSVSRLGHVPSGFRGVSGV